MAGSDAGVQSRISSIHANGIGGKCRSYLMKLILAAFTPDISQHFVEVYEVGVMYPYQDAGSY
jgi:hypothetical protein